MFTSGTTTIFVSDMDRAVDFYTKILGLKLAQRFGNHWASVEAGQLSIGLHPASSQNPAGPQRIDRYRTSAFRRYRRERRKPQTRGGEISGRRDAGRGVTQDNAGRVVWFEDPGGNLLYMIQLKQWGVESRQTPVESPAWAG